VKIMLCTMDNLFTFPASAARAIIIESPYEYEVGTTLRARAIA
jgi:hypothetical protein